MTQTTATEAIAANLSKAEAATVLQQSIRKSDFLFYNWFDVSRHLNFKSDQTLPPLPYPPQTVTVDLQNIQGQYKDQTWSNEKTFFQRGPIGMISTWTGVKGPMLSRNIVVPLQAIRYFHPDWQDRCVCLDSDTDVFKVCQSSNVIVSNGRYIYTGEDLDGGNDGIWTNGHLMYIDRNSHKDFFVEKKWISLSSHPELYRTELPQQQWVLNEKFLVYSRLQESGIKAPLLAFGVTREDEIRVVAALRVLLPQCPAQTVLHYWRHRCDGSYPEYPHPWVPPF